MCGRFALHHTADDVAELFELDQVTGQILARYNIAPGQPVHALVRDGAPELVVLRWGLVPAWADDPAIGNRMINARAETLAAKPAFRNAFRHRRCLLPASGFDEWRPRGSRKEPTYIRRRDGAPLALAGLWEQWRSPEGEPLRTCTIVTTAANSFMAPIHDRMPAILDAPARRAWMEPDSGKPPAAEALLDLLQPYRPDELCAHPVSRQVNIPGYDSPDCIAPVAELNL